MSEPSKAEIIGATRIIVATQTESLPQLLANNADKNQLIKDLIVKEIELRATGIKRIPMIEEAIAMFGDNPRN